MCLVLLCRCRKGSDAEDLVYADEANLRCPQVVIKFYESKLAWRTPSETETSADEKQWTPVTGSMHQFAIDRRMHMNLHIQYYCKVYEMNKICECVICNS